MRHSRALVPAGRRCSVGWLVPVPIPLTPKGQTRRPLCSLPRSACAPALQRVTCLGLCAPDAVVALLRSGHSLEPHNVPRLHPAAAAAAAERPALSSPLRTCKLGGTRKRALAAAVPGYRRFKNTHLAAHQMEAVAPPGMAISPQPPPFTSSTTAQTNTDALRTCAGF